MINQALNGFENPASQLSTDLPYSQCPTRLMIPAPSKTLIKSVISSSGDQSQGGSMLFQFPAQNNAMIKTGSCYLKGNLNVNQFLGYTGGVQTLHFNNLSKDASSLVQRYTVNQGGTLVDQEVNEGSQIVPAMLLHMTNVNAQNSYKALSYAGSEFPLTSGNTTYSIPLVIPLTIGCFNSEKSYPLFTSQSPVVLEVQLESDIKKALGFSAECTGTIGGFTFKNAQIVYESIEFEQAYCNEIINTMRSEGSLYQLPCSAFQSFTYTSSANVQQLISAAYSSVNAIFTTFASPNASLYTAPAWNCRSTSLAEVYLDGVLKNSVLLDGTANPNSLYAELRRCVTNVIGDSESCSWTQSTDPIIPAGDGTYTGSYIAGKYLLGINTQRCNDMGLAMKGSPCSNITLRINSSSTNADQLVVLIHYDYILSFSADGTVSRTQ